MGDGGDQLGVAALGAAAGLGVAQGDDDAVDGAEGFGTHVAGGDQDLAAAGEQEVALGLTDADGEAAVGVGELPPAAALQVFQGQCALQGPPEGFGGGGGGDADGGGVETDHPAVFVRDDQTVGQLVRVDAEADEIAGCAGRGRTRRSPCSRRAARADAHPRTPPLNRAGALSWSPY